MKGYWGSSPALNKRVQKGFSDVLEKNRQQLRVAVKQMEEKIVASVEKCRTDLRAEISLSDVQAQKGWDAIKKLETEYQCLKAQLDRVEKLFGGREIPWEKMLDMYNRMSDSVHQEVKREMELREKKMVGISITQQLDERLGP